MRQPHDLGQNFSKSDVKNVGKSEPMFSDPTPCNQLDVNLNSSLGHAAGDSWSHSNCQGGPRKSTIHSRFSASASSGALPLHNDTNNDFFVSRSWNPCGALSGQRAEGSVRLCDPQLNIDRNLFSFGQSADASSSSFEASSCFTVCGSRFAAM